MPHTKPINLDPLSLDRFLGVMVRAGVTTFEERYAYADELLAAVDAIAAHLRSARLRHAVDATAADSLRQLADLACDQLNGRVSGRMLAEDVIRAARRTFGERTNSTLPEGR